MGVRLSSCSKKRGANYIVKSARTSVHYMPPNDVYLNNGAEGTSSICEHITSTLFRYLGIPCQETRLLVQGNKVCVVIKMLKPPNPSSHIYSFGISEDAITTLAEQKGICECGKRSTHGYVSFELLKLIDPTCEDIIKFFNMLTVDALVGNVDRHQGNWGVWFDKQTQLFGNLVDIFDNELSLSGFADDASLLWEYTSTPLCQKGIDSCTLWDERTSSLVYIHEHRKIPFSEEEFLTAFHFILETVPFTRLRKDLLTNLVSMRCQILFDGKHPKDVVNNRPWLNPNLY
jgi:hypothetical protein